MEQREIDLSISCYGKVKGLKYDVVILPWGATEPHNLHLPYLTDCLIPHDLNLDDFSHSTLAELPNVL